MKWELREITFMRVATVVARELRVLSRRRYYYVLRAVLLGLAFCLYGFSLLAGMTGTGQLQNLGMLSTVFFGFGGTVMAANSINAERREKTLGLLLLTPLRFRDVLSGKFVSGALPLVLCLAAIVPVIYFSLLSGGVTWEEVLRLILNVGASMLLGVSIGLFWSVVCRDPMVSTLSSFGTLLGFCFLPVFFQSWIQEGLSASDLRAFFFAVIAGPMLNLQYLGGGFIDRGVYLGIVFGMLAWTFLFYLLAIGTFRIVWTQETKANEVPRRSSRRRTASRRKRPLAKIGDNVNPYRGFLEVHASSGKATKIILGSALTLYFLGLAIGCFKHLPTGDFPWESYLALLLLEAVIRGNMCLSIPKQMVRDRSSGFLELMLISSMSERSVVTALDTTLARSQIGNLLGITLVHSLQLGLIVLMFAQVLGGPDADGLLLFAIFHGGLACSIFFEAPLMRYFGLYWGVRSSNTLQSGLLSYLMFFIGPIVGGFLLFVVIVNTGAFRIDGAIALLVIWHILRLVPPILSGIPFREKLNSLRKLAGS